MVLGIPKIHIFVHCIIGQGGIRMSPTQILEWMEKLGSLLGECGGQATLLCDSG